MKFSYVCSECAAEYPIGPDLMVCPECSKTQGADEPVRGILEVRLQGEVARSFTVGELLPVEERFFPAIPVGNTPLWSPVGLRSKTGFSRLHIKDDGLNPTFSFKDRASFLVSAFARQHGIQEIVLASTGNAGSSMAGIGAAAGQDITIFLPETAPEAKLVQAMQYGATVYRVRGNYDLAYDFSLEYSRAKGSLNRNTGYNPMTIEGKKTVSLEVVQQLGEAPDHVFVSAGDGCIVAGVLKGFKDLHQLGLIDQVPVVHAVQAETSDALYRAHQTGRFERIPTHTVADSICVDVPRNGFHALKLIRDFSARILRVSDQEILAAQHEMASGAGLFAEPAGATAYAGFLKAAPELGKDATVVVLSTGNGLKDVASALKGVAAPGATISSVQEALD
ncbi:pyridoxal-5'-phosphate-dependent protein subunit beta [bacterium DOLJORAL78_65_58]|nr:MAG: pyridoxal-5'-phosphate-dependent protein subunit beta [bacterium DOLZORAL124_64_63]PIE76476.1 MAG: pyridoxal-5'-phosphate-dependent protein subunit beta [bacterium DOLJORAL78_65_58]